ncbi:MAG: NAD-dependent epimerase/dehydratase family protein [Ignavibacteriales bacterium]|nr:NAD-dependent epimerase/dehydratase family protein [Ignavibacteriales bacterium]
MRILVTGGTGYIGSKLVERLVQQGERVNVLGFPADQEFSFPLEQVCFFVGDVLNQSLLDRAMQRCDRVFHLAAYARNWSKDVKTFFRVNVDGTRAVLDTAIKNNIRKVVCTSTNLTFGPSNGKAVDESAKRQPVFYTPYERSKFIAEQLVRSYVRKGLHVVMVNPTRVFGPGALVESNAVTKMMKWYTEGKWRLILGDGRAVGNYVFVDDVVQGHLLAMEYGKAGENYILGGENLSFNEFFATLAELSGKRRMIHLSAALAMVYARFERFLAQRFSHHPVISPGWAQTFLANWANSTTKAESELGYRPTPAREAMRKTLEWLSCASPEVAK